MHPFVHATVALATLLPLTLQAAWQPQPFEATYLVSMGPMTIGESTRSLSLDRNGNYVLRSSSRATGMASFVVKDQLEERSTWRFVNNGIQALEYRSNRTGGKREKTERVVFDWKKRVATGSGTRGNWQIAITTPSYDKLLYQLAASQDLANGKRKLSYLIADHGNLRDYDVGIVGEETISTALGKFETIKIKRMDDDKRDTTLWIAPSLGYLPVRIDYVELDGSSFKAVLKSLSGIKLP